ncbi:MAG: hypothetical protein IH940_06470, partial [Acidobacteria bacterium]|nr:hypothetical protein [Acidobacteriota bacterium]
MQLPRTRALEGAWEAALATDHLHRDHEQLDTAVWEPARVPGHWQSSDTFAEHSGAVSYRHQMAPTDASPTERCWLVLDGIFNQGDVWIDGEYVGDTEGYFFAHRFDVTDVVADGNDHQLVIDVISNKIGDPDRKHALTGCYQYGDFFPLKANPGGIWRSPALKFTGPVSILHSRVLCRRASRSEAEIDLRLVLESRHAHNVMITTKIAGETHERPQALAAGENRIEWSVSVPEPDLWWPHRLGEQPLYDLRIEVSDEHGVVSDGLDRSIGLRSVSIEDGNVIINGERLYLKGACLAPTSGRPAETSRAEIRRDVDLARSAGLDAISVHAHIAAPELYDHADRTGMLVWQDLPLEGSYARAVKSQALRQAREAVDLLGHRPSVIVWSPRSDARRGVTTTEGRLTGLGLDRSLRRVLSSLDGTRPIATAKQVDARGAGAPRPYRLRDGGLIDQVATRSPALVTRFGAPGVSDITDVQAGRWPRLQWQAVVEELGLDIETQLAAVPIEPYDSLASWARATRHHQAQVLKGTIETARRNKYWSSAGY